MGTQLPPWRKEHNSPLFSAHVYCGHRRPSQVLLSSCSVTLYIYLFGRPFVKRFTLSYRIVVCLSCLSVTLVYCGQVVRWIRMPLGTKVCLGPGNIVLDGNPGSPPPKKGVQHPPTFRSMSILTKWSSMSATAELLLHFV